jgi:hypothetical protein
VPLLRARLQAGGRLLLQRRHACTVPHACGSASVLDIVTRARCHICWHCLQPNRYKEHLQNKHAEEAGAEGRGDAAAAEQPVGCCDRMQLVQVGGAVITYLSSPDGY